MQIINIQGSKYTLKNLITDKNEGYHISKLRPFYFDPIKYDPPAIANKDQQMVIVENILADMRGDPNGSKKQLYFLVKWKDCDDRENTWELYSNLRDNIKLHNYLPTSHMRSLIPRKFK